MWWLSVTSWRETWLWHVIYIVACYHSVKLCALAAQAPRPQQDNRSKHEASLFSSTWRWEVFHKPVSSLLTTFIQLIALWKGTYTKMQVKLQMLRKRCIEDEFLFYFDSTSFPVIWICWKNRISSLLAASQKDCETNPSREQKNAAVFAKRISWRKVTITSLTKAFMVSTTNTSRKKKSLLWIL